MTAAAPTVRSGLPVLAWPALATLGVDAVVTTRHGGVSTGPYQTLNLALHVGDDPAAVLENRARLAAAVGCRPEDLVYAEQVHGAAAAVVGLEDRGRGARDPATAVSGADTLVTTDPGVPLVIMVADCVPVVLVDPEARVLACVHAGWRGTAAQVVEAALVAMTALGARPERMVAGIGPAVHPDRYQVDTRVADALRGRPGGDADHVLRPDGPGRWLADLPTANRLALERASVPASQIHQIPRSSGGADFFSHREAQPTGRFALVAALTN